MTRQVTLATKVAYADRREGVMTKLDVLVANARAAEPTWTDERARRILSSVKRNEEKGDAKSRKALLAFGLVAAAALFCVRAAAFGSHDATAHDNAGAIAAENQALGLGDAGLFTD